MHSNIIMRRPVPTVSRLGCARGLAAAVLALGISAVAGVTPLQGQAVRGTLLDEEGQRPIPRARLYLLDEAGSMVDSTFTDSDGRYRLQAVSPGTHLIHFEMDGWASAGSGPLVLESGVTRAHDFGVVLVSTEAMRRMSEMIHSDERLQTSLPLVCGEALRPWEAGLLVGTVRARATNEPVAGVHVSVATREAGVARATHSNETGIYILCNVPLGRAVAIITRTPDGAEEATEVEIRAGMVSWYDLRIGPRR